ALLAAAAGAAMAVVDGSLSGVAFLTALMSSMIVLVTLVPMRSAGYLTDGAQLLGIVRGDPVVARRLTLATLIGRSYGGTRPRELDVSVLDRVRGSGEAGIDASVLAYEAAIALDRGDFATARRAYVALAAMLHETPHEKLPVATRRTFALPIAVWLAHHERDPSLARAWLAYTRGGFVDPAGVAYAEAGIAAAEGRSDDARRHLGDARRALARLADRGAAIPLLERIEALEAAG
ncbi:MAG TPA: hypothetical protein VFL14_16720, partial [Xanthomonadales bacterium]|nr:hypothetical protein [Xanthomonadales bacterium]